MKLDLSKDKSVNLRPYTRLEIEAVFDSIGAKITGKVPNEEGWIIIKSPLRKEKNASFGIQLDTGNWIDHGTGHKGNVEEAIKQYYGFDDYEMSAVYSKIRDVVKHYRRNENSTGTRDNFSPSTNIQQSASPEYESNSTATSVPEFWKEDEDYNLIFDAMQRLRLSPDHSVIEQTRKYDGIEHRTLIKYKCGIHYSDGYDHLLMPYSTGAQLYRRDAQFNRVIKNLPGSKTKLVFFGSETAKGTNRLHLCKSPRETMLLSQFVEDDDCIGICSGENTLLSDNQKHFLLTQINNGCSEIYVYFDCDTDDAKENAYDIAKSIKRIHAETKVIMVNIHEISGGTCKDLADWVRDGKNPAELMSSELDEIPTPKISDVEKTYLKETASSINENPGLRAKGAETKKTKPFWVHDRFKNVKINHARFIDMLESHGFIKVYFGDEPVTVRMQENVLSRINQSKINDFVRSYIESLSEEELDSDYPEELREKILNAFFNKFTALTADSNQKMLRGRAPEFLTDQKEKGFLFYKNGVVEVTENSAQMLDYSDLDGVIWNDQIIDREISISPSDASEAVFSKFVDKLAQGNKDREKAIKSSLGYLMHTYKDKPNAKAVILTDEKLIDSVDEAHGGTGKSLLIKSLNFVRQFQYLQGKNFQPSHRFAFQGVHIGDQIILIDDIRPDFDFEGLFNVITDDMAIEQKYKNQISIPFHLSPKIAITTNTAVGGSGNSFNRRQNIVELPDYFDGSRTVDQEFGHTFFDEWDEEEWNRFDNFMISCMQFYLQNGLSDFKKNYEKKKLITETSPESVEFFENEIQFDREYNKKVLYLKFLRLYSLSEFDFKQVRFTKHMKKCGDAHPEVSIVQTGHSGSYLYIEFMSKKRVMDSSMNKEKYSSKNSEKDSDDNLDNIFD